MHPTKDCQFFKNAEGLYVAWPLHSPALPSYEDWCFIELQSKHTQLTVNFVRNLYEQERFTISSKFLIWGMKIPGESWALLMGRVSQYGMPGERSIGFACSTLYSIGV